MRQYHAIRVNLSAGTVEQEPIHPDLIRHFIGGKGLGAALLYRHLAPGVDPLSPENILLFALGPLGALAPSSSRLAVVTRSPLTGGFLDCYSGGRFPAYLHFALPGCLAIIVEGRSSVPVRLAVEEGTVEIRDAGDIWGLDTKETAARFPEDEVACIGPAGEHLVRFATISTDGGIRHAARGGPGAVMGSKNLKAVTVSRVKRPPSPPTVAALRKRHLAQMKEDPDVQAASKLGTVGFLLPVNGAGALPTKHWTEGQFDGIDRIGVDRFQEHAVRRITCYGCSIACGYNLGFGEFETGKGPEYETVVLNGPLLGIDDLEAIARIGERCDRLGLDTMTMGNICAWVMEASFAGRLEYPLSFGDAAGAMELVRRIAYREGVGDRFADGLVRAARSLGLDDTGVLAVKHLELASFDPRATLSMALAYATSDRGGCHTRALPIVSDALGDERDPFSPNGHAPAVIADQNHRAVTYSLIACDFAAYTPTQCVEWLTLLGFPVDENELSRIGERIWTLTRLFNVREGFSRRDDALPGRLTEPLEGSGPAAGRSVTPEDFEEMLDEYYQLRQWDEDGIPTPELIHELGLGGIVNNETA
ncbi:MAG: aldehyde ferredoxin oxidoreductase family protein [Methanomicrobiales archaeon]